LNRNPLHIKHGIRLPAALTFFLLVAFLQSPAQQHGKRHVRHEASMPDSVNTADEELGPLQSPSVDSTEQTTTVSSDSEEKEPPLLLRSVPDSVINRQKKERAFAYANDPSWWKDATAQKRNDPGRSFYPLLDSKGFRYFIYIFLGAVLLYALYKIIAENNLQFFYRRPSRTGEGSLAEAALPEEDLDQLLKKALDEGAHRMAVRYLFLKTLRMLEARQLISWHIQTTDEEYARQLDPQPQGESFRWLMRAYERVWYGKFPLTGHQFARLLQYFQDFHTSIDRIKRA